MTWLTHRWQLSDINRIPCWITLLPVPGHAVNALWLSRFFVTRVYEWLMPSRKRVGTFSVSSEGALGTPKRAENRKLFKNSNWGAEHFFCILFFYWKVWNFLRLPHWACNQNKQQKGLKIIHLEKMLEWITYTIRVPRDFQNLNALPWRLGVRSWGGSGQRQTNAFVEGKTCEGGECPISRSFLKIGF